MKQGTFNYSIPRHSSSSVQQQQPPVQQNQGRHPVHRPDYLQAVNQNGPRNLAAASHAQQHNGTVLTQDQDPSVPQSVLETPDFYCEIKSESPLIVKVKSLDGASLRFTRSEVATSIATGLPASSTSFSIPRKKRKVESDEVENTSQTASLNADEESGEESSFLTLERKPLKRVVSSGKTPPVSKTSSLPEQPAKSTRGRLRKKRKSYNDESDDEELKEFLQPVTEEGGADDVYDPNAIDAPPPGQLASLWYSQESFIHVFVIEKILAWKSRPKHAPPKDLTLETALKIQEKAIEACAQDQNKRMEISRVNAMNCPVVLSIWHGMQNAEGQVHDDGMKEDHHSREEVFLIKWRGRSYKHCSWERASDLIKFDASNNTAKGKINRFVQSQEMTLGKAWKKLLEDGRRGAEQSGNENDEVNGEEVAEEEEYFPSDYLEVERILVCDEGEMNLDVLAKQRSKNLKAQKNALREQEDETCEVTRRSEKTTVKLKEVGEKIKNHDGAEESWDPEDYVRYVVKWKALPMAELTWEYWKDLKNDYVEEAEDFWYRQRPPSDAELVEKPHPEIHEFRKMTESPFFGLSSIPRPVFDFKDGYDYGNGPDDEKTSSALQLRSYQIEGVNWLLWNWFNKRSCILADEMGLGKTITSVCFLRMLSQMDATRVRGPFLVVAPLSLINQWQSEVSAWTPDMNIIVYHGHADARIYLQEHEFYYNEPFVSKATSVKLKRQNVTKFQLMITTYEVVMKDITVLSKIRWRALIVDEAHRLKNNKSRLFLELGAVPRDFCLLLTGTPLQNSTEELFALLNFADQVNFQDRDAFIERFGQLTDSKQVSDLHAVLKPYLLRRVKEDVAKSLPPKEETILEVSLTPLQKTFYKAIYERNTAFLFKGAKPSNAPSLMNIMMELRKCCNHPFLIRGAEEKIIADAANAARASAAPSEEGEVPSADMLKLYSEQLVKSSGKMVLLEKLLPKLYDGGHKVLIFSQMVRVLDLLADFLRLRHYKFERLDGSTSAAARNGAVDRFNRVSCQRFVMLLSTRAGGLGLNLTSADVVIINDSDWNPQNDLQAMARAHRIGQTRAVRVYRLLTAKTYEMHMFHSASMKLGLDRAVLAQQRQNEAEEGDPDATKGRSKTALEREKQAKEIDELLKKGAYDVFRDDDDQEAEQFMETDIDKLLERSAKPVTYGNTANAISSGLGSFSKASFVTSTEDGDQDVDLDDPDFWRKTVGLEAPPETSAIDEATALLVEAYSDKKRNRKQVQVYDPYAPFAESEKKKDEKQKKSKSDKQEKEKSKLEKKKSIDDEKDRKSSEGKKSKQPKEKVASTTKDAQKGEKERKTSKESKPRNGKTAEMLKKERLSENKNPVCERVKYAWEAKHRDLVVDAILRFGFGRFSKVRHEASLVGLPIQDMEVFLRAFVYQMGLQAAVSFVAQFRNSLSTEGSTVDDENAILSVMGRVISKGGPDGIWIGNTILTSLRIHNEVCNDRRMVRVPPTLVDATFVSKLRNGCAIRALRRLSFLVRLNQIVNTALDTVIQELGPEELGKRGSPARNSMELDVDMKAKLVTTEELSHAVGKLIGTNPHPNKEQLLFPAPWWDRSCDIALILGTFIHGLGSYENIGRDPQLPFSWKIDIYTLADPCAANSMRAFSRAVKEVSSLLWTPETKEKMEGNKAQTNSVENGSLVADVVSSSITENSLDQEKVNSESLTLDRLVGRVSAAFRSNISCENDDVAQCSSSTPVGGYLNDCRLPMPDGKLLDKQLVSLVELIESNMRTTVGSSRLPLDGKSADHSSVLWEFGRGAQAQPLVTTVERFQSSFPASSHPDASHYANGPAAIELETFAASDAAKKREPGIPLVFTRIGVAALVASSKDSVRLVSEKYSSGDEIPYPLSIPWTASEALRRNVCVALLNVGSPLYPYEQYTTVHSDLVRAICPLGEGVVEEKFVTWQYFHQISGMSAVDGDAASYVNDVLLPHCLRLCLHGNGVATKQFEKEPAVPNKKVVKRSGICPDFEFNEESLLSSFGDEFIRDLIHFPDPCVPLEMHSDEAIVRALAILRRVKLMKAVRFIVGGGIPAHDVVSFLRGPSMRKNLDGLPTWWCPWIHDLAVLVNASILGLFALHAPSEYTQISPCVEPCLGREGIEQHIRSVFVEGQNDSRKPMVPQSYLNTCSKSEVDHWIRAQASQFPSARVLERRLALICSSLTSNAGDEIRYDNVPMFDHGGWPWCSLSDVGMGVTYGQCAGKMLNLSLLRRVEEDS